MFNRSKIVIDVDSFIRAQTFGIQVVQQNRMPVPKSWLDDRVDCRQQTSTTRHAAPRRFQMVTFGMI
jgi:hypothetical protein